MSAPPDAFVQAVATATDALADLSAELEARGCYASSVPAGAYARIRPVHIFEQWLPAIHAHIDAGGLDARRDRIVSRDYLHRLVDALAPWADISTGRNCMPGHHTLGAQLARPNKRAPLPDRHGRDATDTAAYNAARHIHNALAILAAEGFVVCVEQGRLLNGMERLEEHANGSRRRRARSVYALTLPAAVPTPRRPARSTPPRAKHPVDNRPDPRPPVRPVFHPPRRGNVSSSSSDTLLHLKALEDKNLKRTAGCATLTRPADRLTAPQQLTAATPWRAPKKRRVWNLDWDLEAFAIDLQRCLPGQLRGVSTRRVAATTKRFWQAGWRAPELADELVHWYEKRDRPFPAYRPGNPPAWLGAIARDIDHTITPPVRRLLEHFDEADTELCPHEWPGGSRISRLTHVARCPQCRRNA